MGQTGRRASTPPIRGLLGELSELSPSCTVCQNLVQPFAGQCRCRLLAGGDWSSGSCGNASKAPAKPKPGPRDTGGSTDGKYNFDPSFSDVQLLDFNDRLVDNDNLDSFIDTLSDAERRAYTERVVGLQNTRGGNLTGGKDDEFSVGGALAARFAFEVADLVADEIPVLGQVKGAAELVIGKNILGEELGVLGRIDAGLNTIPGGGLAKEEITIWKIKMTLSTDF